jgi:alanine racemase
MTLKANVTMVKDVEQDTSISYGRIFKTCRQSKIATVPIGYADGYTRLLNNKGQMLIHGKKVPVVGKICMDQCMVDVTGIDGVEVGDEAVIFGCQEGNEITVEEIAAQIGTINYELVCIIGKRIPRVYFKDNKIVKVLNYLI